MTSTLQLWWYFSVQQAEAESTANIIEENPAILRNHGDDEKDMFATDDDEDDDDDEVQVVEVSKANATSAADISCIVLDDSTGSNETPSRTSAFIKVPSGRPLKYFLVTDHFRINN